MEQEYRPFMQTRQEISELIARLSIMEFDLDLEIEKEAAYGLRETSPESP